MFGKKEKKHVAVTVEHEFDIGEIEIIVSLINGQEFTVTRQGHIEQKSGYAFKTNVRKLDTLSSIMDTKTLVLKTDDNGNAIEVINTEHVVKARLGEYTIKLAKYSILENSWVDDESPI